MPHREFSYSFRAILRASRKGLNSATCSSKGRPVVGFFRGEGVATKRAETNSLEQGASAVARSQTMLKMQDDAGDAQPRSTSEQQRDAARLLGDALSRSRSISDDFQKRNFAVASEKIPTEDSNQPLTSPTMNTYTEAVKEFTTNATAFIEHLPLLTKARAAYEVAIRTSTEMRKILDTSDENLRTLMTQLEQQVNLREVKSATDKKPPEAAKVESIKETKEGGGRAFRWP